MSSDRTVILATSGAGRLKTHVIIGGKLHEKGSIISREVIPERFREYCVDQLEPRERSRNYGTGTSALKNEYDN